MEVAFYLGNYSPTRKKIACELAVCQRTLETANGATARPAVP
jgi:hypothetical protein